MDEVKVSKYISFILRHRPDVIGAEVDKKGWMYVDDLIKGVSEKYPGFNMKILEHIVETDSKKRYQFNDYKSKIRACQGHSINVNADLKEIVPPDRLFHGTSTRFLKSIMSEGILRMSRTHVHLSKDYNTAYSVGSRHGEACILTIRADKMREDGIKFYESENGVILVDYVDPKYIMLI